MTTGTAGAHGIVDMHAHVVPDVLPFGMSGDDRWPSIVVGGSGVHTVVAGDARRAIGPEAWDLDRRATDLDRQGVATQVVSPMPGLMPLWAPASDAHEFCMRLNRWVAEAVAAAPTGRYQGMGILCLQDPDLAVEAVHECRALGLCGVELPTRVGDASIGDRRFLPVFAAAAELGLVVLVHAFSPPGWASFGPGIVANAVTYPPEVGSALNTLLTQGVLADVPRLRLVASHGGGTFAWTLGRLRYAWERSDELRRRVPEDPLVYARRIHVDSLVFGEANLAFVVDVFGDDRVVVGSDHPFVKLPAGALLASADLPDDARRRIRSDNATALLAGCRC